MKTKEELNALKEEVETLNKKLAELNEDELQQVSGGNYFNELTIGDITPTLVGRPNNKYTDGFTVDEGADSIEELMP